MQSRQSDQIAARSLFVYLFGGAGLGKCGQGNEGSLQLNMAVH